jgi:hypothetical protein
MPIHGMIMPVSATRSRLKEKHCIIEYVGVSYNVRGKHSASGYRNQNYVRKYLAPLYRVSYSGLDENSEIY